MTVDRGYLSAFLLDPGSDTARPLLAAALAQVKANPGSPLGILVVNGMPIPPHYNYLIVRELVGRHLSMTVKTEKGWGLVARDTEKRGFRLPYDPEPEVVRLKAEQGDKRFSKAMTETGGSFA